MPEFPIPAEELSLSVSTKTQSACIAMSHEIIQPTELVPLCADASLRSSDFAALQEREASIADDFSYLPHPTSIGTPPI